MLIDLCLPDPNELTPKAVTRKCVDWIRRKARLMSNTNSEHMGGFLNIIHSNSNERIKYVPLSGFTTVDKGM